MSKIYEALEEARKRGGASSLSPVISLSQKGEHDRFEIEMEEEMVSLYHLIASSLPEIEHRSILFVGSSSDEGTSTIARQLAKTASVRLEKSVLIIDLDRSRPDLHVYAGPKPEKSIDEVVKTGDSMDKAMCQVEETSLFVMPLFHSSVLTPKTVESTKTDLFWGPLKEKFDLIIVDSPPATGFPDGPGIASRVDGVVLVVEAEKTNWQVALAVKNKIIKHGGNILGVVFNKRKYYIPQFIYKHL